MSERNVRRRLAAGLTPGWLSERGRAALPAPASWDRPRLLEVVRTVDVGPFAVGREPRVVFVVKICKDLERAKRFMPIVYRRASYLITPSFGGKAAQRQIEVVDPAFGPDAFVRGSAAAALKDVVAAIERAHGRAGRKTAG